MLKYEFSHPRLSDLPSCRLISTDAAARGIDISGVKCVVNYDAPQFVRTYVHRSAAGDAAACPVLPVSSVSITKSVSAGLEELQEQENPDWHSPFCWEFR